MFPTLDKLIREATSAEELLRVKNELINLAALASNRAFLIEEAKAGPVLKNSYEAGE